MNKWRLMVIGIVVVALIFVCFGCGRNPESAKQNSESVKQDLESANLNFLDVANKMGRPDDVLAEQAIRCIEAGYPWVQIDEMMLQTTPETQDAYRKYRSAVLKSKGVSYTDGNKSESESYDTSPAKTKADKKCSVCGGTGKCTACKGLGRTGGACYKCKGLGKVSRQGKFYECDSCKGTGKGTGCGNCNQSGKCSWCNGRGYK